MTGSSEVLLKAWYVNFNFWETEEDTEGKERLRKVVRHESIYTILEMLTSAWFHFRYGVRAIKLCE